MELYRMMRLLVFMASISNPLDEFPLGRDEISAAWVNRCLTRKGVVDENTLRDVHIEEISERGQTADVFTLRLEYDTDAPLPSEPTRPSSLFVKMSPRDDRHRLQVHDLGLYARELSFFRDYGHDPGIAIPTVHFANINPDTGRFLLLMENLNATHRQGGMWNANLGDVEAAVEALAGFHAHWWQHARVLTSRWLAPNDAIGHFEDEVTPMLPTLSNLLRRKFGADYTDYLRFVVENLGTGWHRLLEPSPVHGQTLLHGDYHPKELFFSPVSQNDTGNDIGSGAAPVVATDWQACCRGAPGIDLHRVLLAGLEAAQLRDNQARLERRYCDLMNEYGVNLDVEAVRQDTRQCMLLAVRNWLFSVAFTDTDVLEKSASDAGVDFRTRIFRDFSDTLELNDLHLLLDGPGS
ncbi:MAG: hypothetical protein ACI8PT_000038 [Gammaproteobacteria bacterium]